MQRDRKGRWFLIYAPISGASLFLRQKCENAKFEERKRWECRKRGRNEVVTQQKEADSHNFKKSLTEWSREAKNKPWIFYSCSGFVLWPDLLSALRRPYGGRSYFVVTGDSIISHYHIHQNLGFDTFLFFPLRSSLSHRKWKWNMHRLASRCAAWDSGWGPGPDCHVDYVLRINGTLCTWGHLHCGSITSVRSRSYIEEERWLTWAWVAAHCWCVLRHCWYLGRMRELRYLFGLENDFIREIQSYLNWLTWQTHTLKKKTNEKTNKKQAMTSVLRNTASL